MEEPVQTNWTTASALASMELPSVKELAKEGLAEVPKRYLRTPSELERPPNNNTPPSLEEVPVIEMSKLLSPELHASELRKLDSACKEWGFFQLINHGVDSSLVECIKKEVAEFFDLPMEEKKKLWQKPEDGQGFGQLFVASEEQKLEWADLFVIITLPEEIRVPRLFSNIPQPFRDHLNTYCLELKKLAIKIIELMAEALNIDPKEIVELSEKGWQSMRMNYYPPCPQADKVIGLNPHSDICILTILLQVNEMKGLQIRKDGKWITVTPLPNAFIINIGDTLELINHGVDVSLVENVKKGVTEFFNLPMDEKNKFWQNAEDGQGFGQLFVVSEEQKLDWADLFAMLTLPQEARTPRLFPNLPLPFRDNLNTYCIELRKIAIKMIELVGEALKIEPIEMKKLGEEGWQTMRMNYYPPCPQADKVIGLSPHSDIGILTILLHVNEIEGLQINKDGTWVPISPLPNAFVINIGDSLEIVSNGIYRSVEHRATVNSEKERMSIATFYSPKQEGNIGPSPSLVTPQTPPLFKTIRASEFRRRYFTRQLSGKSQLDFIRIQNENQESTEDNFAFEAN